MRLAAQLLEEQRQRQLAEAAVQRQTELAAEQQRQRELRHIA